MGLEGMEIEVVEILPQVVMALSQSSKAGNPTFLSTSLGSHSSSRSFKNPLEQCQLCISLLEMYVHDCSSLDPYIRTLLTDHLFLFYCTMLYGFNQRF